jgi:hypothetical protein
MIQRSQLQRPLPRCLHSVARIRQFIYSADFLHLHASLQNIPHFDNCILHQQRVQIRCALDPVEIQRVGHHFTSANQSGVAVDMGDVNSPNIFVFFFW